MEDGRKNNGGFIIKQRVRKSKAEEFKLIERY